ncbi:MAG: hypothetical protein HYR56_29315 [Acidobacteria bacterium]|nr:hypothetical protein [Acidobacteriota bacterium]
MNKTRTAWLEGVLTAASIAVIAALCTAFNGGISIGASNHSGLLPVVRRLLDPNYLPGDFNISLRLYHHRVFAWLLAGASSLLGETRGLIALHVLGALLLAGALWYLCRTVGLGRLAYLAVGLFIATGFLWAGRGLEENDFIGNAELQPPLLAHAFVLLSTAMLIQRRYALTAMCAGLAVLFHLQIGVIWTLMIAPFFVLQLRTFGWREVLKLAACYLAAAAPAFGHLLGMLRRGLLQPVVSEYSLAYYIDFRHPHHFALMSAAHGLWVGGHFVVLGLVWWWLRRGERTEARAVGVLFGLSAAFAVLALMHFSDYYLLKNDKFANLQCIRLSPLLTVFGTLAVVLLFNLVLAAASQRQGQRQGQRWLVPALNVGLILAASIWGYRVARQPDAEFRWGVTVYSDLSDKGGNQREWQWIEMCNWIKAHGARDTVYLTSPANEGFTVLTDRSNVVEFKTNPDGALQMNEWFARLKDLTGGKLPTARGLENRRPLNKAYGELSAEQFAMLAQKYRAGFAVVPKQAKLPFEIVYENAGLKLVKLPAAP